MGEDERSLQENQRYQGNISCKVQHNKDRNGMYKTEAEDINKRWQDYTDALGYFLILQKNNVLYVSEAYHFNLSLGLMVSRIYDFL